VAEYPTPIVEAAFGAGEESLLATWTMADSGLGSWSLTDMSDITNYTVQIDDELWFEEWVDPDNPGTAYLTVDLNNDTDTVRLADSGAVDQHGHGVNWIDADLVGEWHRHRFPIPASWVGDTVNFFLLVCFQPTATGTYRARFRNVKICDSSGTVRKAIWAPGDAAPALTLWFESTGANALAVEASVPSSTIWNDLSASVRAGSWTRGRTNETEQDEPGRGSVTLDNRERDFDPTYPTGPHYGYLRRNTPVRVLRAWDGTDYAGFGGFAEDWHQTWDASGQDAVCELRLVDGFSRLAAAPLRGQSYSRERADTRIGNVLDDAGWAAADRDLDTGLTVAAALDLADTDLDALAHCQAVALAEGARFFMNRAGQAAYNNRHASLTATSQATFDEDVVQVEAFEVDTGANRIYNTAKVQAGSDGTLQTASDATSIAAYGILEYPGLTGLVHDDDNESDDKADYIVALHKDPKPRYSSCVLRGAKDPGTLWPLLLPRELGERITISVVPPAGGAAIEQESVIEGIEESFVAGGDGDWTIRYRLSGVTVDYSLTGTWVVGTAALGSGVLDY
jgi:hypothetical protein